MPSRDMVTQAIQFMQTYYTESITLERLAGLLECSPRHLTRLFKKTNGLQPDYVSDPAANGQGEGASAEDRCHFTGYRCRRGIPGCLFL